MAPQWTVVSIDIYTTTSDKISDTLYANGRMQVPVDVLILTKPAAVLTEEELSSIKLVHYNDTAKTLSGGWVYSDEANEFAHSLDPELLGVSAALPVTETGQDNSKQLKRYWVSTKEIETLKIAASIQQPDGKTITSNSSYGGTFAALTGKTPITYTTDNVDFEREDTSHTDIFDQDNYYVSSRIPQHPFRKAVIHAYNSTDYGLINCYSYVSWHDDCHLALFYMWDFGPESQKTVGVGTSLFGGLFDKISVNQKPNALCLTRLLITAPFDIDYGTSWWYAPWFVIYDVYGNVGQFSVDTKDRNLCVIGNENPPEDRAIPPFAKAEQ
ncbi:hypothetical protein KXW10_000405 [Aspergillus fumigatus]|nr:hypothetical protein KXW10_000405 [Aspergillus fumigatus]